MSGDTIVFYQGSTFNIEGQFFDKDGLPFNYTDADLLIYETLNINVDEIDVVPVDKLTGTFTVSISLPEVTRLPQGRNAWFKLNLLYPDALDNQVMVFPPIWIDTE